MAPVENDDVAHALVRFSSGARGVLTSSRIAHGRKNGLKVEVHGTKGMLWLDNERMNELNVYIADGPADRRGFRRILVVARSTRPTAISVQRPGTASASTSSR